MINMEWNNRSKKWVRRERTAVEVEAWRTTKGRIHWVEQTRFGADRYGQHTDAFSLHGPCAPIKSFKIGWELAEGIVADKRLIGRNTEYLLKPHTKASRRRFEARENLAQAARQERWLNDAISDGANMTDKEIAEKRAQIAALRESAQEDK